MVRICFRARYAYSKPNDKGGGPKLSRLSEDRGTSPHHGRRDRREFCKMVKLAGVDPGTHTLSYHLQLFMADGRLDSEFPPITGLTWRVHTLGEASCQRFM